MTTIYRYEVPVDDQWHDVELSGRIVHVASRNPRYVEFWALSTGGPTVTRHFRVVGTGHPVPDRSEHVGTALADFGLVWHLMEIR